MRLTNPPGASSEPSYPEGFYCTANGITYAVAAWQPQPRMLAIRLSRIIER